MLSVTKSICFEAKICAHMTRSYLLCKLQSRHCRMVDFENSHRHERVYLIFLKALIYILKISVVKNLVFIPGITITKHMTP